MLPRDRETLYWNDKKRYFTVSTCVIEELALNKNVMSPSTEAFMLVCLEGYGTVWKEQFKQAGRP
jgi:hypothetical protein